APGRAIPTMRYLQRKAQDTPAVATPEPLLDAAAATSGDPLPGALRGRFEASLGADLSGAPVHPGAAAGEGAAAVGARADRGGQDIHFGRGCFDTASDVGVHLSAPEVARTVQQAGGTQHTQCKLEVSAATDAAEVEADAAADAMVS